MLQNKRYLEQSAQYILAIPFDVVFFSLIYVVLPRQQEMLRIFIFK